MSRENFDAAIESAKRLERKLMEYVPYSGDIEMEKTLDMEPSDYIDLSFQDLVNEYERDQKILSTRKMAIFATGEKEEAKTSVESAEVETKLRKMTTETLEKAKEVAKEPVIEKEVPKPRPAPIEFERPAAVELEKEKPIEFEREAPAPAPREEVAAPEPEEVETPEAPKPRPIPPALKETPDEAAEKRYQQMEEHIRSVVGEKADELALKKKMLELTKQLFKEKSHNKRAEIKLQITVLKNMLVQTKAGKGKKGEPYGNLYQTMVSTQQTEIAQTKDRIIDSYNKQIKDIKKKFYEDLSAAEGTGKKKEIYEKFVFSITSLVEQLPAEVKKQEEFSMKKHLAELEKLKASCKGDKKTTAEVEKRIAYVNDNYAKEFGSIKRIIGSQMDSLIEITGADIFKKPGEEPKEKEADTHEIIKEINESDDGSLLYYLHSKQPEYYRLYERKQVSKAEAVARAKMLKAKEKGLPAGMIKKYFSEGDE